MLYRYEHPEQFSGLNAPNFAEFSGNIVLWGAGKIGSIAAHVLKQKGIRALAFVDISKSKQGTAFCGLEIISPEAFFREYKNAVLIITTVGRDDVIALLKSNGFSGYYDAWPLLLEFDFADYSEQNQMYMKRMISYYFRVVARSLNLATEYVANRLRVMVTSKCSLRCKECSAFAPYVPAAKNDDWENIISDITTVLDALGKVEEIEFLGGEPLLHPDLDKIIGALAEESRIKLLTIVTNGTIIPAPPLVQALKNDPRTMLRVSNYGEISFRIPEIEILLKDSGIAHEIIDYKTWYKASEIGLYNETDEEIRRKFDYCMQGCGIISWAGKLFLCGSLPFLLEAGAFPPSSDNFCYLRDKNLPREQLLKMTREYIERSNTNRFLDACRYCSGKSSSNFKHPVPVAEQADGLLKLPAIGIV